MLLIAQKQAIDKKRAHPPIFSRTTLGEYGPGVTTTRDWLATRYRRHLSEVDSGPRPGQKTEEILGRYSDDFNMMLTIAIKQLRCEVPVTGSGGE